MNQQNPYDAATRSLEAHGLLPGAAANMIRATRSVQGPEWKRILERCGRGEVSRIYVVAVSHGDAAPVTAFVYAPGEEDNIRHVIEFVSQGPIGADDPKLGYYPVSAFDVGPEVKKAVLA